MRYKHIAIEGNIGAGKSSLTNKLAKELDCNPIWEVFENNPFLLDFYNGNQSNVFQLEVSMLIDRIDALKKAGPFVADFWLEKSLVFASVNLSESENQLFRKLFIQCTQSLTPPSLVIYLECSVDYLIENIQKRNRPIEQNIDPNYLIRLHQSYHYHLKNFKSSMPVLIVNVEEFDFINNQNDFDLILNKLETKMLSGTHILKK